MNVLTNLDEYSDIPEETSKARKRKKKPENWKRTQEKRQRYSNPNHQPKIACKHLWESSYCQVSKLQTEDIQKFYEEFSVLKDYVSRKAFVMSCTTVHQPSRRRPNQGSRLGAHHSFSTRYFVSTVTGQEQVCKNSFMSILGVQRRFLETAAKEKISVGTPLSERRGGSRVTEDQQQIKENIVAHIKMFRCRSSHYSRN